MGFLEFLETNSLAVWLSQSTSIFAYPTLLAFHTFGMAFLVGISTGIALRMLVFRNCGLGNSVGLWGLSVRHLLRPPGGAGPRFFWFYRQRRTAVVVRVA